ncbi:AAA family ATPase [Longirhabdus pacifica]|uniref:AAA family ATPase n=1 Tax=Longirhabdus pacifica TaxID=2305227 RepID=UPI0010089734|nr:SMC family ATPase [Longirhabdus pacifica]
MKPIQLSLAGLQSYRERQTIDFTSLSEAGIFGIFGPTGSGKSSILDAITLALFGKVERATNGTQGIMNHAEDKLEVSFTFSLTVGKHIHAYRIERQYKRANDVSLKNTISRFIVHVGTEQEKITSDKQQDVNAAVEQLLGLTMQDFTRAIVLPQGKFAQFLTLKGVERRQMLQRIFSLETYGDRLQQNINAESKAADVQIKQAEAEQIGLGDASVERMEHLSAQLLEANERVKNERERVHTIGIEVEEKKQWWQWQQELTTLQKEQHMLEEQRPTVQAKKKRLEQLQQALALKPIWQERVGVEQACEQLSQQLQQRQTEKQTHDQQYEQAVNTLQQYKHQWEQEQPALQQQLQQAMQALEVEQELLQLQQKQQQAHTETEKLTVQCQLHQQQCEQKESQHERALQKQQALKLQLKSTHIHPDERAQVTKAQVMKDKMQMVRQQLVQAEQELEKNKHQWQGEKQQQDTLQLQMQQYLTTFQAHFQQVEKIDQELSIAVVDSGKLEMELDQTIAQWDTYLHGQQLKRYAVQLAQQLEGNKACPVCGSSHHPHIVEMEKHPEHEQHDVQQLQELKRTLEPLQMTLRHVQMDRERQMRHIQQLAHNINAFSKQEALFTWQANDHAVSEAAVTTMNTSIFHKDKNGEDESHNESLPPSHSIVAKISSKLSILEKYMDQIKLQQEKVMSALQREIDAMSQLQSQIQTKQLLAQNLQDTLRMNEQKYHDINETWNQLQNDWQKQFPTIAMEQVEDVITALEQKEEQQRELNERIEKSITFIEQVQQQILSMQKDKVEAEKSLHSAKTALTHHEQDILQKESQLQQWLGGKQARGVKQQIEETLHALKMQLQQAEEMAQKAQASTIQSDKNVTSVEQKLQWNTTQLQKIEQTWQQAFTASSFQHEDDIQAAYEDEALVPQWENELQHYEEQVKHNIVQMNQYESKLAGHHISEEAWHALQQKELEVKQALEQALQWKAKVEQEHEDITRKHERWQQLEGDLQRLRDEFQRLQTLQTIFRGNAFVEFIAEEHLLHISRHASSRLSQLSRQRYALEIDSNGAFVIRDDANGGVKRPVTTLSGGETFLTSLSLALALSAQIQLNGQYPLQFFFLDEGFGTLDPELLETVVTALEKIQSDQLNIGIISHVPELQQRLPKKLMIIPATDAGEGSTIRMESM